MKALLLVDSPEGIQITDVEKPAPSPGQALVKLRAAALNRRDEWCRQRKYPGLKYNTILGSDGAGIVESVGDKDNGDWIGREVVINPNIDWGDDPKAQDRNYRILGMPENGTFAEYIAVDLDRLKDKPDHLDFEMAAACPLAGLTAYRAVFTQGRLLPGQKLLVTGIGGGVAQFCFQFAKAAGAQVFVSSGSTEKLARVSVAGAAAGFDYRQEDWIQQARSESKGFDLVIDSSGGDQFNKLLNLIKPGGRMVFYGASGGNPSGLDLFKVFWKQITLQGTSMGTDQEFEDMLGFLNEHSISPIVDSIRPFDDIVSAFDQIRDTRQFGKLVVRF